MAPRVESPEQLTNGEAGVSLVEIVVAMFLFAVMSVAILPLMMGAVQASAANRDLVAANSLANKQLALLQTTFPNSAENSCAAVVLKAINGTTDLSWSGTTSISVGPCPSSYPATVTVTVRAFRSGSTNAVLVLNTAILVTS